MRHFCFLAILATGLLGCSDTDVRERVTKLEQDNAAQQAKINLLDKATAVNSHILARMQRDEKAAMDKVLKSTEEKIERLRNQQQ